MSVSLSVSEFVFMPMLSGICKMSSVKCQLSAKCQMSNACVDPWDMLNNFCFHDYAQMSLFMGENVNDFFLTSGPLPVSRPIIELVPS